MPDHITANPLRNTKRSASQALLAALLLAANIVFMPAGTADAAASPIRVTGSGDLIVTGTNSLDEITLFQEGPGSFKINLETDRDGGTDYYAEGVTRNVTFNMRGGNDSIFIEGAVDFPKNLVIKWGSGDSILHPWVKDVDIEGNFTVIDGSGGTRLNLKGFDVRGKSRLVLGGGDSSLVVEDSRFFNDFTAATSSSGAYKQFDIERSSFDEKFTVKGGNKPDAMKLTGGWFGDQMKINLRGGDDALLITGQPLIDGRTTIDMGSGDDSTDLLTGYVNGQITVKTGNGDDYLRLVGNDFASRSTFDGGRGTDMLVGQVNDFAQEPRIVNFE